LGLGLAAACATDDYTFVKDPKTEHCANDEFDPGSGETDTDCGGEDCKACELGRGCEQQRDCVAGGLCIDGFCQAPGCDNGALDEGETGVDCGGTCSPCEPGMGCEVPGDCLSEVCTDGTCAAPTCEDGVINGTETGRDCGGGLCDGCGTGSPCNEPTDCRSGVCGGEGTKRCEVSCIGDTGECDGDTEVECETNLLTDPLHCGDCETVCDLDHAEQSCVSGRCVIGSCEEPYEDCNNDAEDGCETNLETDALHCGACGAECSDQNGTPSCDDAECEIDCDEGFFDCNTSTEDGCEQNIGSDVQNCGECERVCSFDEGETPFCVEGECGATVCPEGFGNCDGQGDDCEKDLTDDVMHCGRCGGECTVFRGTPRCDENGCGVRTCESGWANCNAGDPDGGYMNGCETNTELDPMNCGMCGRACTVSHGTGTCVDGECRVMACESGWSNCDSSASDGGYATGCETNSAGDNANCGTCGRNCNTVFASANATGRCDAGTCRLDECLPNFGDCDTNANTCESDFRTDEGDCGNCDTSCSPTGTTSAGNQCISGTCTPACDGAHENCDAQGPNGCEINISNNVSHCGGCNSPCATGRPCINSMCGCSGGLTLCDDACVNTATDPMHCGGCDDTCQTNANTTANGCMNSVCMPTCANLRGDCDDDPWDGCETSYVSNNAHCGACNQACQTGSSAHVSANTCSTGGVCQPTCAAGWDNCDGKPWDGCETDTTTLTNCGQCGRDCAESACGSNGATSCCVASGSSRTCQAQITIANDVDAFVAGGNLSFMHSLQPGMNRLILLAVASEVGGGGATASRPDIVTYGGTAMTPGTEQSGGTGFWSPDLFFYYLVESGIGTKTGNQTVVVNGAPSSPNPGSPSVIIANLVQFSGVRQSSPLGPYVGGTLPADGDADVVAQTLAVATSGSRIYTLTAGMFCGGSGLDPYLTSGATPMTLLTNTGVAGSNVDMRASGAYAGSGAATVLAGGPSITYTVGWNYAFCSEITHEAVVVSPAQQ
jgi:hypothetical protein